MKIDDIINDNYSGSMILLQKMVEQLNDELKVAQDIKTTDVEKLYENISECVKSIVRSQPNMASLRKYGFLFTAHFKRLLAQEIEPKSIIIELTHKLKSIEDEIKESVKNISLNVSKILAHMPKVMTISNSTLVRRSFDEAIAQNKHLEVTCLKSDPPGEGVVLAEYLSKFDVKVRLAADFEMGLFMDNVNFVLISADRILENEIINKSGTLPLCLTAKYFNIPVYLISETAKILFEQDRAVKFRKRDAVEIYDNQNNDILVDNFYFERIPLLLIDKVICENGIFDTEEFKKWYLKG